MERPALPVPDFPIVHCQPRGYASRIIPDPDVGAWEARGVFPPLRE